MIPEFVVRVSGLLLQNDLLGELFVTGRDIPKGNTGHVFISSLEPCNPTLLAEFLALAVNCGVGDEAYNARA
jgi:hypothetical protein